MKSSQFAHLLISTAAACTMLVTSVYAEDESVDQSPPSAEEIADVKPDYSVKTQTVYESSFLPGVRLCKDHEVDYRGDFRKVNCQDEALIDSVSTRQQDPYNTKPTAIVDDRIETNGNIFRINFRKKAADSSDTSDN